MKLGKACCACKVLAIAFFGVACGKPCAKQPQSFTVSTTAEATQLAAAVDCEGGSFNVAWAGEITVANSIVVGAGTSLRIIAAAATGSAAGAAVMHGANVTQLIQIGNGKLYLKGLVLQEAASIALGAAVHALEGSDVTLIDCVITKGKASTHAGIYTAGQLLVQGCTFSYNFAGGITSGIDINATDYFAM
jgi:hypothetical protein